MLTIKYLSQVAAVLRSVDISAADAKKIISVFSAVGDASGVDRLEKLDLNTIKAAAREKGVKLPADLEKKIKSVLSKSVNTSAADGAKDHTKKETVSGSHNAQKATQNKKDNKQTINENKTDIKENIKEDSGGDAGGDMSGDASGGLPFDFCNTIKEIIKQWCVDNDIDNMCKASSLQWGAACMFCGQYIKQNKILYDKEKTAARGGVCQYDLEKVKNLADIWLYLCQTFGKVPLVHDFIYFSGVSQGWFYGTNGHNNNTLTSAGGEIIKKLSEIQAAAIGSGIVDGRENPTGKIYFSKAVLGWSDSGGGQIMQEKPAQNNNALPLFDAPGIENN